MSPINKYNPQRLLDMEFPTLFPTCDADWLHPHICNVEMHKYGLHLLRYYAQKFRIHAHFQYFLLTMIMRHHSQGTTCFFLKKNIHENARASV